ncbi:MAG: haloacid dehalogenase-like hydrolase [Clostridia bacterium]|nr:haloacid dehalogenase-like hydrolase [Clostridia bacterium]
MKKNSVIAIVYDFDKTLSTDDMQNFSFIPELGMEPADFWARTSMLVKETGMENILAYMYVMIEQCKEKNIPLTREYLNKLGKDVKFFDGVTTWFKRVNSYAEELGYTVEHYVVSSGTKEIIEGTSIAKEFKEIYACEFLFNEYGIATWPKIAINYTAKTQYLFRISKGVLDPYDHVGVNANIPKRIPYKNMIYIGDGMTDIPCMTLVKEKGGKSIAIYPKGNQEKVSQLVEDGRINYICRGDYSSNSEIEKIIKLVIDQISILDVLSKKEIDMSKS